MTHHNLGDYFPNLEIVRKRALEANAEFGVIVSVGTFAGVRGASEAELRWQAFTTLAYGARSLGWFCYLTEQNYGNWNNWEDMVVNTDGTRTRHYSMLKYLNGEVLASGTSRFGSDTPIGSFHIRANWSNRATSFTSLWTPRRRHGAAAPWRLYPPGRQAHRKRVS